MAALSGVAIRNLEFHKSREGIDILKGAPVIG